MWYSAILDPFGQIAAVDRHVDVDALGAGRRIF